MTILLDPRRSIAALATLTAISCTSPPARIERTPAPDAAKPAPAPPSAATAKKPVLKRGGGFYKDDGPADAIPENLESIPDAEPKWEPLHKGALKPYVVLGKSYVPNTSIKPYRARGLASWYGKKFHGQKTSIGEPYDMFAMTAAHTTLALPSYVRVSNPENGRSVVVRITDRGPFHEGRIIDLSYTAAHKLGIIGSGSGQVDVEAIIPGEATGTTYAQVGMATRPIPANVPDTKAIAASERTVEIAAATAADELGDLLARLDKPEPASAIAAGSKGTWLQLGAFGNPDNAEALKGHLGRELDWLAETIQIHASGGIQRVQLGPYRTRAEAEKVAERIRVELGTKPAFVVR